ncbi:MAG TPA: hypothetical protein VJ841_05465 [Candidatus Saccharimonadales bacterium]|nr:hypothetical protein [Candidatus Saccharimonadales bacterium]
MFTAEPNVTRTTAGVKTEGSVVFEHEVGSRTFKLIPMVTNGKKRGRSKTESWTIDFRLFEEVTLRNNARVSGGGVTIERHGSKTVTFKTGQKEYRGTEFIKVTIGSGRSRTELVMTRRYATETASTIRNLREHPEKYSAE